jgi:hypothetical protein
MLDALRAELLKLTRHKATWFLVWLYPIGFVIIFSLVIMGGLVSTDPPAQPSLQQWLRETALVWAVPGSTLGRYLIAAFVAVAFAGEYGWNTWKLVIPHRRRGSLVAAKFEAILLLLMIAFTIAAVICIVGSWLEDLASGDKVPAGIGAGGLLKAHGETALASLAPGLLTIGYASLAAVLTRSTIAALVISIVAITVEQLFFNFAPMFSAKAPGLVWALFHALPGYHFANISNWIAEGSALEIPLPGAGTASLSWPASAGAAAAWVGGVAALTFASFRRQDIN